MIEPDTGLQRGRAPLPGGFCPHRRAGFAFARARLAHPGGDASDLHRPARPRLMCGSCAADRSERRCGAYIRTDPQARQGREWVPARAQGKKMGAAQRGAAPVHASSPGAAPLGLGFKDWCSARGGQSAGLGGGRGLQGGYSSRVRCVHGGLLSGAGGLAQQWGWEAAVPARGAATPTGDGLPVTSDDSQQNAASLPRQVEGEPLLRFRAQL